MKVDVFYIFSLLGAGAANHSKPTTDEATGCLSITKIEDCAAPCKPRLPIIKFTSPSNETSYAAVPLGICYPEALSPAIFGSLYPLESNHLYGGHSATPMSIAVELSIAQSKANLTLIGQAALVRPSLGVSCFEKSHSMCKIQMQWGSLTEPLYGRICLPEGESLRDACEQDLRGRIGKHSYHIKGAFHSNAVFQHCIDQTTIKGCTGKCQPFRAGMVLAAIEYTYNWFDWGFCYPLAGGEVSSFADALMRVDADAGLVFGANKMADDKTVLLGSAALVTATWPSSENCQAVGARLCVYTIKNGNYTTTKQVCLPYAQKELCKVKVNKPGVYKIEGFHSF